MDPRFREGDGGIIPLVIENTAKLSAIALGGEARELG
jgi:hypothetical protein